jgi:hypothetical protein
MLYPLNYRTTGEPEILLIYMSYLLSFL